MNCINILFDGSTLHLQNRTWKNKTNQTQQCFVARTSHKLKLFVK